MFLLQFLVTYLLFGAYGSDLFVCCYVGPWWPSNWERAQTNLRFAKAVQSGLAKGSSKDFVRQYIILFLGVRKDQEWVHHGLTICWSSSWKSEGGQCRLENVLVICFCRYLFQYTYLETNHTSLFRGKKLNDCDEKYEIRELVILDFCHTGWSQLYVSENFQLPSVALIVLIMGTSHRDAKRVKWQCIIAEPIPLSKIVHCYCAPFCQVGHLKNMEKIRAWSDKIILHFWHSASTCKSTETNSDDEAVLKMKVQQLQSFICFFLLEQPLSTLYLHG